MIERLPRHAGRVRDRRAHTLVELLLAFVLLSLVMASALSLLVGQRRFHAGQVQLASARDAARVALQVLAAELRAASPASGDLYAIAADSVALRSYTGFGVVCAVEGKAIAVRRVAGGFTASPYDSVLVYGEGGLGTAEDDAWSAAVLLAVRRASLGRCPDGVPPDVVLTVGHRIEAALGGPVRAFRPYVYRLYRGAAGQWWLGRRLRQGRIQPVAGPFADAAVGGLRFEFLGSTGLPSADPRAVTHVRISVRARSPRPVPGRGRPHVFDEALSTVVFLRNSCVGGGRRLGCPAPRRYGP